MSFTSLSVADDVEGFVEKLLADANPAYAQVLKDVLAIPLAKELWLRLADSLFVAQSVDSPHVTSADALGIFRNRPPVGPAPPVSTTPGIPAVPAPTRVPLTQRPAFQWLWGHRQQLIQAGLTLAGLFGLKLPPGLGSLLGGGLFSGTPPA